MASRREITKKFAREYAAASRSEKGVRLDALVQATGWTRDHARRAIRRIVLPVACWRWRLMARAQNTIVEWAGIESPCAWNMGRAFSPDPPFGFRGVLALGVTTSNGRWPA